MFEDLYSPKELELNNKLLNECLKEIIDFDLVRLYLSQGADPLGPVELEGWKAKEHIYDELVNDACDNEAKNLPEITRVFLEFGMDIAKPRVPYDGRDSINPLWSFSFITNENSLMALKLLLENGVSYEMVSEFWDHAIMDLVFVDRVNPNDPAHNEWITWTMKMIMLCASYPHILKVDKNLKELICYDINCYDVRLFENWNDYYYKFDDRLCPSNPEFHNCIIRIYYKETKEEVWKMGVSKYAKEYLKSIR
ncbi:MAG: hypothetical protein IJY63_01005 [Clostridia bacterium]|nr:hypothetical protein [Clostridia bacterium]